MAQGMAAWNGRVKCRWCRVTYPRWGGDRAQHRDGYESLHYHALREHPGEVRAFSKRMLSGSDFENWAREISPAA